MKARLLAQITPARVVVVLCLAIFLLVWLVGYR